MLKTFLTPFLFLWGSIWSCFGQNFNGTNSPGSSLDFSFTLTSAETNLVLSVNNTATEYSHLFLKKGAPASESDYDYRSVYDGLTNSIALEEPELSDGTWYLRVQTPVTSLEHEYTIPVLTNSLLLRSASAPAFKPQIFTATGNLTAGQWHYYRVEIPENSPGWRVVVQNSGTAPMIYVRRDNLPDTVNYLKAKFTTLILTDEEATPGVYYIGVYQDNNSSSYTIFSEVGYLNVLTWDQGTAHEGTEVYTNQSPSGGHYHFKITAQSAAVGAWRTALNVTSGEADLYMQPGALAYEGSSYQSAMVGSDGLVLSQGQFSPAQDWYIMVYARSGAVWTLMSGDVFVQDLGSLSTDDSSSSGPVEIGPEGYRFFKTVTTPQTLAWRLGLNGAGNQIYVRKSECALDGQSDLNQAGQMLVVPDYLDVGSYNGSYFVGIPGAPGTIINLDSRQQPVTDLAFPGTNTLSVTGYGYTTYRVQVPVEQIAWDVKVTPTIGNPNVAVRRDKVPNEWNNDAFSEVTGSAADSISLVPPTLSDGTFFITVYGQGNHSFTLTSKNPVITDINYISSTVNDDTNRVGWRYYRVADIPSQLGTLGWFLELSNHVEGTEITLRRNAVPGRWYYRNNGDTGFNSGYVDYGRPNFLQRPGHQADIWYVGIYQPTNNLGAFHLNTSALTAPTQAFDNASVVVTSQPADTWRFFRIDVPTNTLGWGIRLVNVTNGSPRLVVRRDQLPSDLFTSGNWLNNSWGTGPSQGTNWTSGYQWAADYDWTDRQYDATGTTNEYGRILSMGMGNPLEAGTYYIGVTGGGDPDALSYTLQSRGIGPGFAIPVVDLDFENGSITNTLVPREAAYYRVTITNNPPNWKVKLNPTLGEALMQVQKEYLPNISGGYFTYNSQYPYGGQKISKAGAEHWVALPEQWTNAIPNGVYYVAVVGEGQNIVDTWRIGTGPSAYVIQSLGALVVTNLGTLSEVDLVQADSVEGGTFKAYQFTVPNNTLSMEVRLEGRMGNPLMSVINTNLLPVPVYAPNINGYGSYGGFSYMAGGDELITLANPPAGIYSLVVNASATANDYFSYPDASYTVRVHAVTAAEVAFDGGTFAIVNQPAAEWRYFRITVPTNTLGWDLRLVNVTNGSPRLVVRRDQLPIDLTTSGFWIPNAGNTGPSQGTNWTSGYQWAADYDWTVRQYDATGTTNEYGRILSMGMGNPLEAGTYYIGVTGIGDTNALSYTLQSRGIGPGFAIPVVDLDFENGIITNTLAPREAAYYRVTITNNLPNWKLKLNPTLGEALMQVQKEYLPNISGGYFTYNSQYPYGGQKISKAGAEHWVALPEQWTNAIPNGVYYVAVIGEGQNIVDTWRIGTGPSTYVIQSMGALGVTNLGTLSDVDLVQADSVEGGTFKAYQFTVPSNTLSMEVRLEGRMGNPLMSVINTNLLPYPVYAPNINGYGSYGGFSHMAGGDELITLANPPAGIYSLVVNASATANDYFSYPDASYTVRVHAVTATEIAFDGGTSAVVNQPAAEWRYFKITVPTNTLGWDLRLVNVTNGIPRLVVRRDQLPSGLFTDSYWIPYGLSGPFMVTNWISGNQWAADYDWTDRQYDATGTTNEYGRILAMSMGNPLEAGTYYIGVTGGGDPDALSYSLQSRGIGPGFAIPVVDLDFENGSITNTLAPREAAYYRVTITNNPPNWKVKLNPTAGEALMQVQMGYLPNIQDLQFSYNTAQPFGGEKMSKAGPEHWVALPEQGTNAIPNGVYYVAVVGEGQNATNTSRIGTGSSTYMIQSLSVLGVTNLGTLSELDLVLADSVEGGTFKAYQFTVPTNTMSIEVRLEGRVGNPWVILSRTNRLPQLWNCYPCNPFYGMDYGSYGGEYPWEPDDDLITIPNPRAGTLALSVYGTSANGGYDSYPDSSYTLRVRRHSLPVLNFNASLNMNGFSNMATGLLANSQREFYRVDVPAMMNGQPVVGWRLSLVETQGVASIRVRKDLLPEDDTYDSSPYQNSAVLIAPPYLTPGTWYVEVKGNGSTAFTLTSANFVPDRPVWTMPASGETNSTPGLTDTPYFGDTGTDPSGNQLPGDRGVDLENGKYHYYAVQVPSNDAVLIRTWLEAISGNPDIYVRVNVPPTLDHSSCGSFGGGCSNLYDRIMNQSATEYGNWVPLDGKYESFLTGGTWYFAVRAAGGANCRYRLRISAGDVQELDLEGGSFANQILAARDWRYYRVTIPTNAPEFWTVGFGQQAGDVVMYIRDTSPPGSGLNSDNDFRSWGTGVWPSYGDRKNDGPYDAYDAEGTYTFDVPPLRPGHTYYVGFRAVVDATFSVTSSVSSAYMPTPVVLAHYGGYYSNTIAAGSSMVFRIDVPPDAARLAFATEHSTDVAVYLEQGTLPNLYASPDWQNYGAANSSLMQNLNTGIFSWPWQPGHHYYVIAVNNTGVEQSFTITTLGTLIVGDSDGDGMPDWWETYYNLDAATSNAPTANADSDEITDWEEYIADTHPGNSASFFPAVTTTNAPVGHMVLVVDPTSTGRVYHVRWTTNLLANPQNWSLYLPEKTGTGSHVSFVISNDVPYRIYRTGVRLP